MNKLIKLLLLIALLLAILISLIETGALSSWIGKLDVEKLRYEVNPVLYLYPEKEQEVQVKISDNNLIKADYPKYDMKEGWKVNAYPDGRIMNYGDGREYSYLFWEGTIEKDKAWNLSTGYVVSGEDVRDFLRLKLKEIGFTPQEYNEFVVYWYPLMKDNKYNLIHFALDEYDKASPLDIRPAPDSILRVCMVFKPLDEYIDIPAQDFEFFERKGFTVVEWGGVKLEK